MKTLSTKLDDETERALDHLVDATGKTPSALVRDLLREADRERILAQVADDARAIMNDPEERAELTAVAADMDALRAW